MLSNHLTEKLGGLLYYVLREVMKDQLMTAAKEMGATYELVVQVAELGHLPVVNFAAGGIATPDAAL